MKYTDRGMCICSNLPFKKKKEREYEWLLGNVYKQSVTTAKIESMLLRKSTAHK